MTIRDLLLTMVQVCLMGDIQIRLHLSLILLSAIPIGSRAGEPIVELRHDIRDHNSQVSYYLDYSGDYMAQTFTVPIRGTLAEIGVQASLYVRSTTFPIPPADDLHLRVVRTTEAGIPAPDMLLAEATIRPSDLPVTTAADSSGFTTVDVRDFSVEVRPGELLAILLSSDQTDHSGAEDGAQYLWHYNRADAFPGGEFMVYSPQLYGETPLRDWFITDGIQTTDAGILVGFIPIPEPGAVSGMAILTLAGRLVVHRRRPAFGSPHAC